jgi:hypothetical protein
MTAGAARAVDRRQGDRGKFDLKTDSLVGLKKAGAGQGLEAGGGGSAPPRRRDRSPRPRSQPGPEDQDVIYQLVGDKYVEMFATSANLETNMAFFQSKSEVVLEGRKARYRTKEKQPVFLSTYSQTDAPLVKLKPGDSNDDRNLKIGSGAFMPFGGTQKMGVRNEDKIAINIERDARGFKVAGLPLPPGEYGFILATGSGQARERSTTSGGLRRTPRDGGPARAGPRGAAPRGPERAHGAGRRLPEPVQRALFDASLFRLPCRASSTGARWTPSRSSR